MRPKQERTTIAWTIVSATAVHAFVFLSCSGRRLRNFRKHILKILSLITHLLSRVFQPSGFEFDFFAGSVVLPSDKTTEPAKKSN